MALSGNEKGLRCDWKMERGIYVQLTYDKRTGDDQGFSCSLGNGGKGAVARGAWNLLRCQC